MTPWARGAHTSTLLTMTAIAAAGIGFAAVWWLSPAVAPRDVYPEGERAIRYAAGWLRFLADGGAWPIVLRDAQRGPMVVAMIASFTGAVAVVSALLAALEGSRPQMHGTAAFATVDDCRRMGIVGRRGGNLVLGLFRGAGVLGAIGLRRKVRLVAGSLRHALVIAGTRSGKTAGVIVQSLLEFVGSQIVVDPKGELIKKIAPLLRKMGIHVYIIDWSDEKSPDAWNPLSLSLLPKDPIALERHCERVAGVVFQPDKAKGTDKYFQENAHRNASSLFMYIALESQANDVDAHPADVLRLLSDFRLSEIGRGRVDDKDRDRLGDQLRKIAAIADLKGYPARIVEDLNGLAESDGKERTGHVNTLKTGLQVFRSGAVQGSTRETTFVWQDLREQRSAVFIRFPESDAAAYGRLTSLFFDTFFAWAVDTPKERGEEDINILADEFSSLPALGLLDSFLAKGAGHGTTITMVVQSLKDLQKHYDAVTAERLIENIEYFILFAITDKLTREFFSSMAGDTTLKKRTTQGGWFGRPGVSETDTGIPLILPQALGEVPFKQHLLFVKRHFTRPVICNTPLHPLMKLKK